jgi:hypothetical protein
MKRECERDAPMELPALPWDVWCLIIEWAGIQLVLEPVCHQWLAAAERCEGASLDQWLHEVADAGPRRNLAAEIGLAPSAKDSPYHWCKALRGIPGIADRAFCRAVRRVLRLYEWLAANEMPCGAREVSVKQRLLDNVYMLWRDYSSYGGGASVLRVTPRLHFNHLLRRPREGVDSAVGPVPLDDRQCTEEDIYIGGEPLRAIPLTQLRYVSAEWAASGVVAWATAERRIQTTAQYGEEEDRVSFVYVAPPDGQEVVMRYVRNMRYWAYQCIGTAYWLYQSKVKEAAPLLSGVWARHCRALSEQTRQSYDAITGRGERHWCFADEQMAAHLCDLTALCGLLVVDARGTRVHAPASFSAAELEQEEGPRAFVRLYAPLRMLSRLIFPPGALPPDIFHSAAMKGACAVNAAQACIDWPDMQVQRAHHIPWERANYGLDRLPGLLNLRLVEFIDVDAERPDGYLFATLLSCARQALGAPDQWNLGHFQ